MDKTLRAAVADSIVGEAQDARWIASTAANQLTSARYEMLAGDLDDADAAMRRAEMAMRMIADSMAAIIRTANRAR
jgi:hypothetical protein